MKDGLKYIVGKQIAAVVVASSKHSPQHQVFLVFPDGNRFEFYGENFSCCSGLDHAEGIERYVQSGGGKIDRVYGEETPPPRHDWGLTTGPEPSPPYHVTAPEQLEGAKGREVKAWEDARAAVRKARARITGR